MVNDSFLKPFNDAELAMLFRKEKLRALWQLESYLDDVEEEQNNVDSIMQALPVDQSHALSFLQAWGKLPSEKQLEKIATLFGN